MQQVLDSSWNWSSHAETGLGGDDGAGSAGLHLHHSCQRCGGHRLGRELGHCCHVTGQTLRHAGLRVRLHLATSYWCGDCSHHCTTHTDCTIPSQLLLLLLLLLRKTLLLLLLLSLWLLLLLYQLCRYCCCSSLTCSCAHLGLTGDGSWSNRCLRIGNLRGHT